MNKNLESELSTRKSILAFLEKNSELKKSKAYKYLKMFGYKKDTITRVYKRFKNNIGPERAKGSGKKTKKSKREIVRIIHQNINNKVFKSYRYLGRKVGCDKNTIKKYLKEMGIVKKARKIIPKVSLRQRITQRKRLGRFALKILQPKKRQILIMDDESYFSLEDSKWTDKYYYVQNECKLTSTSSFIQKSKFPHKLMMWLSISEKGISQPVFFKANMAINSKIYVDHCLPKLLTFKNRMHRNQKTLFWPDLASCHYSKTTQQRLKLMKINCLPKHLNPPNSPQLRPIEKFWAYLKRNVYKEGKEFKNISELKNRIRYLLKKLDFSEFRKSMKNLPITIRRANRLRLNYGF